ncbi:TPA: BREX-1 system adenine-specific DNA-methyltransferase PglX [Streptococcus suis]|nr:BREX-1 system adenine-specific DNA-methyltransferase PglX [Streptococcus suis]
MNKNAIQKYAIWARNELIEQVKQRAFQYGIDEKGYGDENASVIAGRVLSADEKRQRRLFVDEIKKSGFSQAVEEVAYTWFNRFIALRYMEVNDFLPTHIRVFSDVNGNFNPEILTNVLHLDLPGLDKSKVSEYLNGNQTEELYRYLLLTQCNALNDALPEMFEKLGGYTEMLLPNNILKQDSILARLVKDIDEDDWKDAVQIIGWMYQYYNADPKQAVFDGLKKNVKITKEKIPAATQLFTPDWIVRYMVENSLGRLWLESHPNKALKDNWDYYLEEADQTPEVAEKLCVLRSQSIVKSPEDIRLIDPCMGSGHILVYAFDVLIQIYESEGYNPRDAARFILEKNIYGLDIDRRAYQLAYFSLMMKARQYNRRIFAEEIKPQVYYPAGFPDGEEYGSLVKVEKLQSKPIEKYGQLSIEDTAYDLQLNAWNFKRLLAQKYDVVVTNPPYMADRGMNAKHLNFIKKNYSHGKIDSFAAFMIRCGEFVKNKGFIAMITQQAWMFLSSFENLRKDILSKYTITNMAHLGNGAFGFADFGLTSFVLYAGKLVNYQGTYVRLVNDSNPEWKEREFLSNKSRHYASIDNFIKIPGMPIAYWLGHNWISMFDNQKLNQVSTSKAGVVTGDDSYFVRLWFEPNLCDIDFVYNENRGYGKYHIMQKGGFYRKYYGCYEYVIRLADLYDNTKTNKSVRRGDKNAYFQKVIGWSLVGMNYEKSFRLIENAVCGTATPTIIIDSNQLLYYSLGLLNSKMANVLMNMFNPTINLQSTNVGNIPLIRNKDNEKLIIEIVQNNIAISKDDWDAFETSWDFVRHPLLCGELTVAAAFGKWDNEAKERFNTLKANEEELNCIFIDIYGLQDELTPEVMDKDVTVRRADLGREIRSLISYAVGCMLGRYSLDVEGLAYAGGTWNSEKYKTFSADKDNILPICDDEYFDDDITGRFVDFVKTVYGADTLEENLKFIADALSGKGTPREVIRNYFLNDFYKDHVKIYQKRPIYWLFDSGKKNGFKALIYMHRYSRDLLAKLRTDYVHEQQERYRTQLSHIVIALNTASGADRAKLLKQQDKLTEQLREITDFEEKVHHLADQNIMIDLDDGVKKNYEIFADVLAKI